ncbi:MAG: pilus assembly protein [Beijerinckiaceae bacterium]|nr:pilus assembly protein [Beijerinckiaceae bacterium]
MSPRTPIALRMRGGVLARIRRMARLPGRATRDESGATAVEFAIISIPFFATIFFLMENGYNFFVQSQLESATSKAARTIMTGSAQLSGASEAQFRETLCSNMLLPTGCGDRLFIDVRSVNANMASFLEPASIDRIGNRFCLGAAGQFTVIRVGYASPVISSMWQASPTVVDGQNVRILRAGLVFRNEPFTGSSGAAC